MRIDTLSVGLLLSGGGFFIAKAMVERKENEK